MLPVNRSRAGRIAALTALSPGRNGVELSSAERRRIGVGETPLSWPDRGVADVGSPQYTRSHISPL